MKEINYKNEDENLYTVDPKEKYNKFVCKECGNDNEFYISQRIKGTCNFYFNLDGTEADNSELHSNLEYRNISKFLYCSICNTKTKYEVDNFI